VTVFAVSDYPVTAVTADVVVQDAQIDHLTDLAASNAAGCGTDQTTENGTRECTERDTDRAANRTHHAAEFSTAECTSGTTDATTNGADDAACFFTDILSNDLSGITSWAMNTHGRLLVKTKRATVTFVAKTKWQTTNRPIAVRSA
jgi:hypothetical protein